MSTDSRTRRFILVAIVVMAFLIPLPASADVGSARAQTERAPVVVLDPGHGGAEIGAVTPEGDLGEKDVNLRIALRLAELLRADGYRVVLTRDADRSVDPRFSGGGYPGVRTDLQARVDIANAAGADLFISIHNNGGPASVSGTEVWYSQQRTFGDRNRALAGWVLTGIVDSLHAIGYPTVRRGIKDDTTFRIFRGQTYNIYVLGPGEGPRSHTPTLMPGRAWRVAVHVQSVGLADAEAGRRCRRDCPRLSVGHKRVLRRLLDNANG